MARILSVEDSPDIRALVRMLLTAAGHEVLSANDGKAGVEAARRERPDLVLMDLSLPVLSGWEATRRLKSDPATATIPVLAVTAHAMQGDRERALAAGCDGFLAKPIDEETFASEIAAYLKPTEGERKGDRRASIRADSPSRQRRGDWPAKVPERGGRILVVDDQPEIVALLRSDLEIFGYEVVTAMDFRAALAALGSDQTFDLAIVDVMLGDESGYDLTAELNNRSPEYLPILLVTAGTIDRDKAFDAGGDDFIGKPIESAELRARVRSLIRLGRAIREQRRQVREGADAYEKLAELDRLKSDFVSTVSHELRTPLNTIILLSHLLDREAESPDDLERRRHDVRVIQESAETLLRMINNILDLAKIEAGQRDLHPQRFSPSEFLREIVDMLEPHARSKGLELKLELGANLPETPSLDREKLSRVLINLVSNVVKYTQAGHVILRASAWQESVTFEVEDTGVGIPAHLVMSAFEPFRQIRTGSAESARGTGLGLPISKQLVEIMGGDLLFDTREGVGTRASFTLPQLPEAEAAEPPPKRPTVGTPREREAGTASRRVLIVEDDESSRYGLKSLLESEGYSVGEAGTLAQADLELQGEPPHVLILDITLPDGDGAEWLKLLRQRKGGAAFPVIALTGVTADEDRRRIEESGVVSVLHKPVHIPLLLDALTEWGQR